MSSRNLPTDPCQTTSNQESHRPDCTNYFVVGIPRKGLRPGHHLQVPTKSSLQTTTGKKNIDFPPTIKLPVCLACQHLDNLLNLQAISRYNKKIKYRNRKKQIIHGDREEEDENGVGDFFFPNDESDSLQHQGDFLPTKIDECPENCSPSCNKDCLICSYFQYHHPSELCLWSATTRRNRAAATGHDYNPPEKEFEFNLDDKEKLDAETITKKEKYDPEIRSESEYSQSTFQSTLFRPRSSDGKKHKKPTFEELENKYGVDYAEEWRVYSTWKKESAPKERIGTIRPLCPEEIRYFDFFSLRYKDLPTIREEKHKLLNPPKSWIQRRSDLTIPTNYNNVIDKMAIFSRSECPNAQRNNWDKVLSPLKVGSLERLLWATAFLKSTNGVADKVSCSHFLALINRSAIFPLEIYKEPFLIAAMIRQTSKWVKNTFVLANIFRHIDQAWKGSPSQLFDDWISFHEMGPKTAALIFHAAFDKAVALPVDSHVFHAFQKWSWTNAKSPDECCYQASHWMDPTYFIKTNDAIGAIRQTLADKKQRDRLIRKAKLFDPEIYELVLKLI